MSHDHDNIYNENDIILHKTTPSAITFLEDASYVMFSEAKKWRRVRKTVFRNFCTSHSKWDR